MTFVAAFLSSLFGTAMVGAAAKYLIDLCTVSLPARFGGFCVALGFALARYSYGGPVDANFLNAASATLGAVIAMIGLWFWLMAKRAADQTDERE